MVLAFVEHDVGVPTEESLQMLTLAHTVADLGDEDIHVGAVGDGAEDLADALGEYGVAVVHPLEGDELDDTYSPSAWAVGLWQAATACGASAILAPGTDRGNELLARIGAEQDLPFAANCLGVSGGDGYEITRQRWGGSLLERARLDADVALLSVALHELPIEPTGATDPVVEPIAVDLTDDALAVRVDRFEPAEEEGISLKDADIVIGGGRGVGSADDFDILEELAAEIGAAVGSSRAAVNEGWRPHDDQIGQTGEKISPTIYIAAGISGAVQHMVGCKGSDHILAINTDPEAGIMQKATWAVEDDLHEVIPLVTEEVKKRKG